MHITKATTIVADVGARYGVHPSWNGFDAPLRYVAFEPDAEEAARLREIYQNTSSFCYEVQEVALDRSNGERDFHLLRHRGLSSCLKPDLTSECFRHFKPGQAEIEKIIRIKTERGDDLFRRLGIDPDFLKVDTEGTEQDVIEGFEATIAESVLGIRASCNFQPCFLGQRLFSESHEYLIRRDFILLNLDYKGFGYPRLGLFRKPDPLENEDHRYGILVAADAVWIRKPETILALFDSPIDKTISKLKLSAFCFFNNAHDVGIDLLREISKAGELRDEIRSTSLYSMLRLRCARFLGRYRTIPDEQWERAAGIFHDIFSEALPGGSEFYPQIAVWVREMAQATK
jgi:FkbM family methyltransferase